MTIIKKYSQLLTVASIFFVICLVDVSNLDNAFYQIFCFLTSKLGFHTYCARYYDIQIWDLFVTIGTLSAGYFAYLAVQESNVRLEIEQSPYVVFSDRIITADLSRTMHVISIKNIGRGSALRIIATADPDGKISIIDGSNPHSIDLAQSQGNNSWAVDEARVREGLIKQGISLNHVVSLKQKTLVEDGIPDENRLEPEEKYKADFNLYLWYGDQMQNKYVTIGKFRHSGYFLKLMENQIKKISK